MYGITETTVHVTFRPLTRADAERGSGSPIGRAIPDLGVYVLDRRMQPVPVGVPGEMCVGGAGVARGYLGRPALTAERFVPDPFGGEAGGRLYRSGDLARRLASGELEYLGRMDQQVKVRGFRIEPGEIEAALRAGPGVGEAVVVVREDAPGDRRLVAYFTADGEAPAPRELRARLAERLPGHMVPAAFVPLERIPLTANGKLDRRALPVPDGAGDAAGEVAPRTPAEAALARVWAQVLGVERVGVTDGFFALGGHSLLAVRLVARIERELGARVPLHALFAGATVESLAALLDGGAAPAAWEPLVTLRADGAGHPLFLVHAVDGHVLSYAVLAERLGDRPVHGLQAAGLEGGEPLDRVEDMADACAAAVLAAHPGGPLALGGWSLGAVVAWETARRLRAAGTAVDALVLLDPPRAVRAASAADPADDRLPDLDPARMDALLRVRRAHLRALRVWTPGAYDGRVLLLEASERPASGVRGDRAIPWESLCAGPLRVRRTPGDHFTLLREPHVRALAERLRAYLDEPMPPPPSLASGPPLDEPEDAPAFLAEVLDRAADDPVPGEVVRVLAGGGHVAQGYAVVRERAWRTLAGLRARGVRPGDRVVLQVEAAEDFAAALWGCLLGGFVAVPVSVAARGGPEGHAAHRLREVCALLGGAPVLAGDEAAEAARRVLGGPVLALGGLEAHAPDPERHPADPGADAVLLLSSGTTGRPKLIRRTHRNLLLACRGSVASAGVEGRRIVFLNWLPLDHNAALLASLALLGLGGRQVHLGTHDVLEDPARWLDALHRYRVTHTGATNHSLGLVAARLADPPGRAWDFSAVERIAVTAEPVVARTARVFLSRMAPFGLRPDVLRPSYGMSEVGGISRLAAFRADEDPGDGGFVEAGTPMPGVAVRVVDVEGRVVPEGREGRVQVRTESVTPGYVGGTDEDRAAFTPGGWFDTGDAGLLRGGSLLLTGRDKDVLIVGGLNLHSQEIEAVVEEVPGVTPGSAAACPVRGEGSETDEVALVLHTPLRDPEERAALRREVRRRVGARFGVRAARVVLAEPEQIPRTPLGKVRRAQRAPRPEGRRPRRGRRRGPGRPPRGGLPGAAQRPGAGDLRPVERGAGGGAGGRPRQLLRPGRPLHSRGAAGGAGARRLRRGHHRGRPVRRAHPRGDGARRRPRLPGPAGRG